MTEKYKALLALLLMVLLFSLLAVMVRFYSQRVSPMFLFFFRMTFAAICFLPFFIKSHPWRKKQFNNLIFTSLFAAGNVGIFMYGIEFTTASASQLIYAAMPVLTVLAERFFSARKYPLRSLLGIFIGLFGVVYIIINSARAGGPAIFGSLKGNLLMTLAMSSWLTYILRSKKMSRYFTPVEIGSTSVVTAWLVSLLIFLLTVVLSSPVISFSTDTILAALYMGVLGTFTTYNLLQFAVKQLPPLMVNLSTYVQPVTTIFLAVILLGERITLSFLWGLMIVFLGVFLTATMEFRKRRATT